MPSVSNGIFPNKRHIQRSMEATREGGLYCLQQNSDGFGILGRMASTKRAISRVIKVYFWGGMAEKSCEF